MTKIPETGGRKFTFLNGKIIKEQDIRLILNRYNQLQLKRRVIKSALSAINIEKSSDITNEIHFNLRKNCFHNNIFVLFVKKK